MAQLTKYKEDFILFLEAGFIAVNQADEDSALKLFKSAELLNPSSVLPKVGVGYLHLHKLDLKKACKAFEEVLEQEPKNEMAKAFLAIALTLGPSTLTKGEEMLLELSKTKDPLIKQLGSTATGFVETCLKKPPSPDQLHRKSK